MRKITKKQIKKISYRVIDFGENEGLTEKSCIGEWIDTAIKYMLENSQDFKE